MGKRNPAIVVREHLRSAKRTLESAIAHTDTSQIYVSDHQRTPEERAAGIYVRARRPDEMPQNRVVMLVQLRLDILAANQELTKADKLLRARLAELGFLPNGLPNTEARG